MGFVALAAAGRTACSSAGCDSIGQDCYAPTHGGAATAGLDTPKQCRMHLRIALFGSMRQRQTECFVAAILMLSAATKGLRLAGLISGLIQECFNALRDTACVAVCWLQCASNNEPRRHHRSPSGAICCRNLQSRQAACPCSKRAVCGLRGRLRMQWHWQREIGRRARNRELPLR